MSDTRSRRGPVSRFAAGAVLTLGLASVALSGCAGPAANGAQGSASAGISRPGASGAPTPASAPSWSPAPAPTATTGPTSPSPAATQAPQKLKPSGPVLPASRPTRLEIPEIGVATDLMMLGRQADGTVAVPPGEAGSPAGWYEYSPSPGQQGPSVILGHVNTTTIPEGVFYRLNEMKPGQQFTVTRSDGRVATFRVDRLQTVRKDAFPTLEVYGNTARAEIRLITCGNYQAASGRFEDNTIVYAHLVGSR